MKQSILLITIILATLTATAQELLNNTPKNKWDIGAEFSSPENFTEVQYGSRVSAINTKDKSAFSMGLYGNYNFHNSMFIRLGVSISNRNVTHHEDNLMNIDTTTHYTTIQDETIRQSSKTITFCIGKNIVEQKFIRAYVGLEVATTFFGNYIDDYTHNVKNQSGIYSYIETQSTIVPGGYAVRLGPFIGCQLTFLKHFSIGPEISYAFQYLKAGGIASARDTSVGNLNNFDYTTYAMDTNEGMGFSNIKVAFNIVYSF
jgi:hypothetical protein